MSSGSSFGSAELADRVRAELEAMLGGPLPSNSAVGVEQLGGDPDPLLTTAQAAALLGITVNRLHYLRRKNRAVPSGGRRWRRWRLSDLAAVEDQAPRREPPADPVHLDRLPTDVAAARLGISRRTFHRWAAAGRIRAIRDSRGHWWAHPDDLEPVESVRRVGDGVGRGVSSAEAAAILGISPAQFRAAAAAGRVPAVKDAAGRWRARPDQLQMVRRARDLEEAQDRRDPANRRRGH